jgi:hypothetical protein
MSQASEQREAIITEILDAYSGNMEDLALQLLRNLSLADLEETKEDLGLA